MSSPHGFRRWRHGSYPCAPEPGPNAARLTSSGEPSRRRATRPTHLAPDTAHSHRNEGESAMQHHQTLLRSTARSPAASSRSSRACPTPRPGTTPRQSRYGPPAMWCVTSSTGSPAFSKPARAPPFRRVPAPTMIPSRLGRPQRWRPGDARRSGEPGPHLHQPAHRQPVAADGDLTVLHRRPLHAYLGSGPRHRPKRDSWTPSAARRCSRAWSQWRTYCAGAGSTDRASKSLGMSTRRLN